METTTRLRSVPITQISIPENPGAALGKMTPIICPNGPRHLFRAAFGVPELVAARAAGEKKAKVLIREWDVAWIRFTLGLDRIAHDFPEVCEGPVYSASNPDRYEQFFDGFTELYDASGLDVDALYGMESDVPPVAVALADISAWPRSSLTNLVYWRRGRPGQHLLDVEYQNTEGVAAVIHFAGTEEQREAIIWHLLAGQTFEQALASDQEYGDIDRIGILSRHFALPDVVRYIKSWPSEDAPLNEQTILEALRPVIRRALRTKTATDLDFMHPVP